MANTFLLAKGMTIGKSLAEPDLADTARRIIAAADKAGCDDRPARRRGRRARVQGRRRPPRPSPIDAVPADQMILDVGPKSIAAVNAWIDKAATLVWNGPLGAFEVPPFDKATVAVARHAAERTKAGRPPLGRRRRRDGLRAQARRRRGRFLVRLDRRRRVPRMAGGQGAPRRRGAAGVGLGKGAPAP